jgi:ubiquinone/menaquinone biosynthesis C-methylase UbiE
VAVAGPPLGLGSTTHTAYDGLASEWDTGAAHVYRPLAAMLVAASPIALGGRLVLDVGSGTGAVARAATVSGARVVAAEQSLTMLSHQRPQPWPRVAADVLDLPFKDGVFDAALAGFLINHMAPQRPLAELARVVGPGGVVLASTWADDGPDPVKAAIDAVMAYWGWTAPVWYRRMKEEVLPITGSPGRLTEVAEQVGLVDVTASIRRVDLGLRDPAAAVAYRMALPHTAAWVAALDDVMKREVTRQAVAAVAAHVVGWRPAVIVMIGRRRGLDGSGPVAKPAGR